MAALFAPKKQPFDIRVEVEIEELLVYIAEWRQECDPGVGKNHVQLSTVTLNYFI